MEKERIKEEKSQNALAFVFRHGRGKMRWMALALAGTLVSVVAAFLTPQIIRFAVDVVLGGEAAAMPGYMQWLMEALGGVGGLGGLWGYALAVVALALASGLFNFAARMGMATGTERFCRDLRNKLFSHVQGLPFKWHVDNKTGDIIQRCTSDLEVVRNFLSTQLLEVVRTVVLVAVALVLMFGMNLTLALVSLAFIPLVLLYSLIFYRLVGNRFLAADEAEGELTINVQENLTAVRVVRAFGRERFEMERFDRYNNRFADLWIKLGHTLSVFWGMGDVATGVQILTVVAVGAVLAANGQMSAGEFLAFVWYNNMLAWPIRALGRTLSEMSKTGVSAARMQEVLDAKPEPAEPAAQKPDLRTDIRFENVTFGYEQQPVLKDLSFTIPKGSTFGIMGATGSGKSTITYLLNRLYDLPPGFGNIWFGDVEIRDIDRQYLRRNVGLVLQEPFLFSKTIEENIAIADVGDEENAEALAPAGRKGRLGRRMPAQAAGAGLDRARIRRAARVAAVDEAITEFSGGYETVVGERGVTLSGGQKQRVAIARTLMLEAPVMVFDDSMSAVDLETDARIRAALRKGTGKATVILISHRINTLMAADRILVLEDGRLADIGTHAELIRRPGTYKRIYDMQSEAAADAGEDLEALEKRAEQRARQDEAPGQGGGA
ncbi:MAG: ABC transporter ATP-binding protein [Oscillospiraceae bacterium]